jgi:hypothetical protein
LQISQLGPGLTAAVMISSFASLTFKFWNW